MPSARGLTPVLMQTARRLNESMFQQVVNLIDPGMQRVTVLGLSFKAARMICAKAQWWI